MAASGEVRYPAMLNMVLATEEVYRKDFSSSPYPVGRLTRNVRFVALAPIVYQEKVD